MLRRIMFLALAAFAFTSSPVAAETTRLTVTAQCSGKWVSVSHGVDLTKGMAFFSRNGSYWYGPIVLDSFVPDTGGGYAHVDYDVDIFVEMRDSSLVTGYKTLAAGKVRTPACGGEVARPIAGGRTTTTTTIAPVVVELARTAPKLVTVAAAYDPWPAIVEAVRALP